MHGKLAAVGAVQSDGLASLFLSFSAFCAVLQLDHRPSPTLVRHPELHPQPLGCTPETPHL